MKSAVKWLGHGLIGAVLITTAFSNAQAAQIDGSIALAADRAEVNGPSLVESDVFTAINLGAFGGLDDFSAVPDNIDVGSSVLDLNNLLGYTLSGADFGDWVTTAGEFAFIGSNVLGVTLEGTFTPAFGGYDPTPGVLVISLTQAGSSYSWSATLDTTPDAPGEVPEPYSAALVAGGLVAVGVLRRKYA